MEKSLSRREATTLVIPMPCKVGDVDHRQRNKTLTTDFHKTIVAILENGSRLSRKNTPLEAHSFNG